ncbi:MAG: hypothetical protein QOF53_3662 [Nocardioidaceae bacterium]|nr:hypothetical protein [Nocardioidaceae bacterium]
MSTLSEFRPSTLLSSLLAALTTWVAVLAWTPFAENPAGFMVPLFGACALVAVSGMLLRSARLPALVVLLAQVLLVLLWLQHRFGAHEAIGGVIPTPDSVRAVVDAVRASAAVSQAYAAPVPVSVPEFYPLLIVAGAFTAVLVDFLAVGLRLAPLAGLPLLAVYTAPVSVLNGGVSWIKFAATAMCFLFLVAAGEERRLAHWGHRLTPGAGLLDAANVPATSQAVWSSARKIGVTATALAVVAPLVLPTFTATLFSGGNGKGRSDGNAVSISNPMVDLKRDLVRGADIDLVTIKTKDRDPSYLRISVLNTFDGTAWRPSGRQIPTKQRANGSVVRPPGLLTDVPTKSYVEQISISHEFASRWLPTPYPVSFVDAPGDWRYDKSTLDFISAADNQTTAGLDYRLRSLDLSPSAAELVQSTAAPLSVFTPNTALPRDLPDYVKRLARNVTKGKQSRFEQAVALQRFFRETGGFRYSLQRSPGNGTSALLKFLSKGKGGRVGYCEQFAAAMALMGRTLGIPSRVAVGFLHPEKTRPDTFVYSSHDLHAWPEMYFGGIGWVRFEPTPQDRTGSVPSYTTQKVQQSALPSTNSLPSAVPSVNRLDKVGALRDTTSGKTGTGSSGGLSTTQWSGLALLLLLPLLLVPRLLHRLLARRRWAAAAGPKAWVEAAWNDVRSTATDLGIPWDDHVTVRTAAQHLETTFGMPGAPDDRSSRGGARRGPQVNPEATAALHRLVRLLEQARYARELPADGITVEQVRADAQACVQAMRAGAGRRRRSRADWLPVSVLGMRRMRRRARGRLPLLGEPGVDRAV